MIIFLISHPKNMLRPLIETVQMRGRYMLLSRINKYYPSLSPKTPSYLGLCVSYEMFVNASKTLFWDKTFLVHYIK